MVSNTGNTSQDKNKGSILIESVLGLAIYVAVMAIVLGLINVMVVQARMQHAITQTALTLSMYSYVFEITGIAPVLQALDGRAEQGRDTIRGVVQNVDMIVEQVTEIGTQDNVTLEDVVDMGNTAIEAAMPWVQNPSAIVTEIRRVLSAGGDAVLFELWSSLVTMLVRPMVEWHLSDGQISGHDFLLSMNVVHGMDGLRFKYPYDGNAGFLMGLWSGITGEEENRQRTVIIDRDNNIRIFVQYDIDLFWGVFPTQLTRLTVSQSAVTRAWLSGYGGGYRFTALDNDGNVVRWDGTTSADDE